MQYLLSSEEYHALNNRPTSEEYVNLLTEAQKVGEALIAEIGCEKKQGGYCDDCPLADHTKVCSLHRDFSQ